MAFKKTIAINDGQIEIQDAYLKITATQTITEGTKNICNVTISFYKNKNASDNAKKPLDFYSDSFIPKFGKDVLDIKAQAYIALKQKDLFKDAIDLLDEGQTV